MRSHKNIAQFVGICVEPLCLISDFYNDGSLWNYLQDYTRTMDENDMKKVAKEICCGMAHLHQEGIIHKDLSSKNCLIDFSSGQLGIRICDFGLNQDVNVADEKVKWMSPETISTGQFSKKSDVWAFGVTLIEVVTRAAPWSGLGGSEVAYRVVTEFQSHPVPEGTPEPLSTLIPQSFQFNPNDRPDYSVMLESLDQKEEQFVPANDCMPPDKASQVPGYKGAMERPTAEAELKKISQPGVYLVRWSAKQKFYSVSYISTDYRIIHFGNIVLDKRFEVVRIPTDHGAFKYYNNFLEFLTDYKIHGVFTTPLNHLR